MPNCPQCTKPLREFSRRCPSCQADLDLLVDFVNTLNGGLERAESLTRSGELGKAFWAYLEVLEADPDNMAARRQISQVVTAVRQFDRVAPGRRWISRAGEEGVFQPWIVAALVGFVIVLAFTVGYFLGFYAPTETPPAPNNNPPGEEKKEPANFPLQELLKPTNTLGGPVPRGK